MGHICVAAAGWVALRVTTEVLTTTDYGYLVLALAILQLSKSTLIGPILTAQVRLKPEAQHEFDGVYLDLAVVGLLVVAALAATLLSALAAYVAGVLQRGPTVLLLAAFAAWYTADAMRSLPLNELNVVEKHRAYALLRIVGAIAPPATAIAACLIIARSWIVFLVGSVIALLAIGFGSLCFVHRISLFAPGGRWNGADVSRWRARIRRFAAPLIPLAATGWVIHLVDRILLEIFHDASSVGQYAALYSMASQPFILLSSVATLVFRPRLFDPQENSVADSGGVYEKWVGFILVVGGLGLITLWLLKDSLAGLLVAPEYRQETWLVGPVAGGYLFLALAQAEENFLFFAMESRRVLIGGILAAIATVVLGLALIPRWGIAGATWSTFLALCLYWVVMWTLARTRR